MADDKSLPTPVGLGTGDARCGAEYPIAKSGGTHGGIRLSMAGKSEPLVVDGHPPTAIDEVVRRRGVDLVVAANRGAGATKMILLGTVADGVLETMPCDVLIARVPGEFRRP